MRSGPMVPKPWGIPGCMATFSNVTVPSLRQHLFDDVVRTRADATGRDDEVGADQLVLDRVHQQPWVVADDARPGRRSRRPLLLPRPSAKLFDSLICPGRERLTRLDELGAGGHDDDARLGPAHDAVPPDRGEQADLRSARAGCRQPEPRRRRLRRCRLCGRARPPAAPAGCCACAMPPSVHSTGTTPSAPAGIGAPVMMRIAGPRLQADLRRPSGRDVTHHGQLDRDARRSAPATIRARTAYPSIDALSKPGSAADVTTFSARMQPCASSSCKSMRRQRPDIGQAVLEVLVDGSHGWPLPPRPSRTNSVSHANRSGPRSSRSHASRTTAFK